VVQIWTGGPMLWALLQQSKSFLICKLKVTNESRDQSLTEDNFRGKYQSQKQLKVADLS
jgi:hypothetical protein